MSFSSGFSTMSTEDAKKIQAGIQRMSEEVRQLAKKDKKAAISLLQKRGLIVKRDAKTGKVSVSVKLLPEKV